MGNMLVTAMLDGLTCHRDESFVEGYLMADCPYCDTWDGFFRDGLHAHHGKETVKCAVCGNGFDIVW